MKHLKHIKLFESIDNIKNDIEEICYELTDDMGFVMDGYSINEDGTERIICHIPLKSDMKFYHYVDIEDVILRVVEIVGNKLVNVALRVHEGQKFHDFDWYIYGEVSNRRGETQSDITNFKLSDIHHIDGDIIVTAINFVISK